MSPTRALAAYSRKTRTPKRTGTALNDEVKKVKAKKPGWISGDDRQGIKKP